MRKQDIKWDHLIILQSLKGRRSTIFGIKAKESWGTLPHCLAFLACYTTMPLDHTNCYFTPEGLGWTLSHTSTISYPCARGSTCFGPRPYPSLRDIATRIDGGGDSWFNHPGEDLYFRDFGFQAHIQVARRLNQCANHGDGRDHILERLLVEGTFDQGRPWWPTWPKSVPCNMPRLWGFAY
jgi:hypothetical protein